MKNKEVQVPPQATDAEKSVLGALIYSQNEKETSKVLLTIASMLDEKDFYSQFHQRVWRSIFHLYQRKEAIDLVTVTNEMRKDREFNAADDPIALTGLRGASIHALGTHINIILETKCRRIMISDCHELGERAWAGQEDIIDLWEELQAKMRNVRERFKGSKTVHISTQAVELSTYLSELKAGRVKPKAKFYFNELDKKTGGMFGGHFIVVAAPGKIGKTSFAIQVIIANAKAGVPVVLFSQEMTKQEIYLRAAIIESDIYWLNALEGRLSDEDWEKLTKAVSRISELPIYVNDSNLSVESMRREIETYIANLHIGLVVADYLQIITPDKKGETREREVADISRELKLVAKQFNVPVLTLSQVNEDYKTRESRSIFHDLDKLIVIKRAENIDDTNPSGVIEVDIKLAQRMAPSSDFGTLKMGYRIKTGSFCEFAPTFPKNPVPITAVQEKMPF